MKLSRILLPLALVVAGMGLAGDSLDASPLRSTILAPFAAMPPIPNPEIPRLTIPQARELKGAVFVDVRRLAQYRKSHIPGALSLPSQTMEHDIPLLPRGLTLVLYCT